MNRAASCGAHALGDAGVYTPRPTAPVLTEERRQVLARVGRDTAVLEVGANSGYFTALLRQQGCRVVGVELDPGVALRANAAERVIVGSIEDPRVREQIDGHYDVVLFMHVLEHLANPWCVLLDIRRCLAPGGCVIALIPNVAGWRMRKALLFDGTFEYTDVGLLDRTHLRFFTVDSARKLFEDTGYRVVEWAPTDVCVPLERRMSRVPAVRRLCAVWHRWMVRHYPNLCTEIALFRALPAGGEG